MATNGSQNMNDEAIVSPLTSPAAQPAAYSDRLSLESDRSSSPPAAQLANGLSAVNGNGASSPHGVEDDPVSHLRRELERTKEEKEALATQYRNLLAKLTAMRTTLGNKLKQDAEELDRREQLVQQLTAQNDDLATTVDTLKEELIASHSEAERASRELDTLRNRALHENAQENLLHERELHETQAELERCRMERDEWESVAMKDRMGAEEAKGALEAANRDLELERERRVRDTAELESERERADNLQSVLEDFQTAKDHELRQAVRNYEAQLLQVTQSLAEFKHRALTAEIALEESHTNSSRSRELEKEVKEKNLLIGKLRHEAVIINEHLMEALRRLRQNSTSTNVDRRLVTNVLLSFLATPRADPKRFEMLKLLASVLSWSDAEREKAGLQRGSGGLGASPTGSVSGFWGRSTSQTNSVKELEKTDETESFSRLWVEFLLTESASGNGTTALATSRPNTSLPGSPTVSTHDVPSSPPGATKSARRLPLLNATAMSSSPNLTMSSPPSRKGKEREGGQ